MMIAFSTFFLFVSFLAWSIFLRHIALYLIQDCVHNATATPWFLPIDLVAAAWWLFAVFKLSNVLPAYFIFLSALWITVHTDLAHMLISRFVSLYLVPIAIFFAYAGLLPLDPIESALAAFFGYTFFFIANKLFYWFKGHDGLGQGDLELMACIGAFIGLLGCWFTLLFGSLIGTIVGAIYIVWKQKYIQALPFGPFLALAASIFVLYQYEIMTWLILHNT